MKSFFFILVITLSNLLIHSQTKKISFSSKESKGIVVNERKLLILWNQVKFKHKNTLMYCDSAIYEGSKNSFIAYNNIQINENDSLKIYGDSLHYFGDIQKAYIYGNVTVKSNKIKLNTTSLIYDRKTKIAYYNNGGLVKDLEKEYDIESKKGVFKTRIQSVFFKENVKLNHENYNLISDTLIYHTNTQKSDIIGNTEIHTKKSKIFCNKGWFDSKNSNASFKGEITMETKNQKLFADSIFYDEISGFSYADGNVKIIDDSAKVIIYGNYGFYNEKTDSIKVWDHAIFTQLDDLDTVNIYADQFISFKDSNKEIFICYNNAVINGNSISGDCDSIFYNKTDSLLKCIDKPIVWLDKNQVSGEKIEFKTFNGEIFSMKVENKSIIINKKDSIHYDQVHGKKIDGIFENNELKILYVDKDGEAIYFTEDEKDSTINEINTIYCESMTILLKNNNIEKIKFNTKPNGKTVPLNGENDDIYLNDFMIYSKRSYQDKILNANGELPKGM